MIHILWLINDLIEFDCYDFAWIRFHYHWYAMTGKCFREDTCYDVESCDVLSLIVSKLRIMTLSLWWKHYAQITFTPELEMNLNHNNYVKILANWFAFVLIWQVCPMSRVQIIIDALYFKFVKWIGQTLIWFVWLKWLWSKLIDPVCLLCNDQRSKSITNPVWLILLWFCYESIIVWIRSQPKSLAIQLSW